MVTMAAGAGLLLAAAAGAARAQDAAPYGTVEAGGFHHDVDSNYGDWNGEFVRAVVHADARTVVTADLLDIRQFGDHTQVGAVGVTHDFSADWYANLAVAGSSKGNTQAQRRLDATVSVKFLPDRKLVATFGVGGADTRDGHRDRSAVAGAAYYFDVPLVLEGGVRLNRSHPGTVDSAGEYVAASWGRDKVRQASLRYGFGREAYQAIGNAATLTDFRSRVLTLTWREWVGRDWAVQGRLESYHNPYYDRRGVEASIVRAF
jgi:YaiO family outer membrane protein